jgi:tetratricopeptide (TPR) repeat protein
MAKEWYRNTTWNETIAFEFETRLKRARGSDSKAQYLKLQACHLLFAPNAEVQSIGINLLNRLFADYPSETWEVVGGLNALGEYYLKQKNWKQAEHYFRLVISHFDTSYIQKTYREAQLKLAEALLKSGSTEFLSEAYQLISAFTVSELLLNNQLFYFYQLAALICNELNEVDEAKTFANHALEIARITESQFTRHKTVGLVKATEQEIKALDNILKK